MRRSTALIAAAILAAGPLTACTGNSGEVSTSVGATAASAPSFKAALSPAEFSAAIKREGTILLDVRTAAEFADGHLPGAVNADVESADFADQLADLDPAAAYALYCRSGNRSAAAMAILEQMGFGSIYHLDGGYTAWTAAGGDVTKS